MENKEFIDVLKLANLLNMNLYKNKSNTKFRLYENNDRLEYTDFASLEEVNNYLQELKSWQY